MYVHVSGRGDWVKYILVMFYITLVTDFEDLVSEDSATPAAELTADQYKVALSHALEELQIVK